ncbi:MAG: DUF3151 family protein [Bifidobacteriaceae bacterium]|jgi:hypothetical protein|nr:DUF3151 family protein [Bifidobacteriaceae bacterium]
MTDAKAAPAAGFTAARPSHVDQVARAQYQAGADLGSVVAAHLDSAWAWGALGAAALDSGDPVAAYSHAFMAHAIGFRALDEAGWAEGQPVTDAVLLALIVTGLAARALGANDQAERARAFVQSQGHAIDDQQLLAGLIA